MADARARFEYLRPSVQPVGTLPTAYKGAWKSWSADGGDGMWCNLRDDTVAAACLATAKQRVHSTVRTFRSGGRKRAPLDTHVHVAASSRVVIT